jgi:flagellar basal-body rod protein FlgB
MGMFVERLLDQGNAPLLEQMLRFTAARHRLIAENVVNVDTPDYRQKDLSPEKFQALLRSRVEQRHEAGPGAEAPSFDDVTAEVETPTRGILFHDGNNRSMEQLMADQAKNAMMHNLAVELLRKQFQTMELALKERVG